MVHRVPFFLPWFYPTLIWRVPTSEKELFLTFDDGPVPGPTDFVLETLARYSCKATFFCIGDNIRKHPELFSKVVKDGHAVGNHTFNHLKGWSTPLKNYVDNIRECDAIIQKSQNIHHKSKLFRPPYGRITGNQINALTDYKIVMWDVLSVDYNKRLSAESCLRNTIAATRPGSIVVFHDSLKAEKNMAYALPRYIEHFLEKGFVFKSLDQ